MNWKVVFAIASLLSLVGCQGLQKTSSDVGSQAWFNRVETLLGVSDGQGHGPDHGSTEWCNAVHFKLYGKRPAVDVSCDKDWMLVVDQALGS